MSAVAVFSISFLQASDTEELSPKIFGKQKESPAEDFRFPHDDEILLTESSNEEADTMHIEFEDVRRFRESPESWDSSSDSFGDSAPVSARDPSSTIAEWKKAWNVPGWTEGRHVYIPPGIFTPLNPATLLTHIFDSITHMLMRILHLAGNIREPTQNTANEFDVLHRRIRVPIRRNAFFVLKLPRISIHGLHRNETYYSAASRSVQTKIDALVKRRFSTDFFRQEHMPSLPMGMEMNDEIIIVPWNFNDFGEKMEAMKELLVYNIDSHGSPKSKQFNAFYGINRKEFRRDIEGFPKGLLDGNLDNFLALPGTSIPMSIELLALSIDAIQNALKRSEQLEAEQKAIHEGYAIEPLLRFLERYDESEGHRSELVNLYLRDFTEDLPKDKNRNPIASVMKNVWTRVEDMHVW